MSAPSIASSMTTFRLRVFLLVVLAVPALRLAGQAQPTGDSAIESHFAAAQKAQRDQNYGTAEREYQAVLAIAPGFAEVHMNLGLVYQLQNRAPEAIAEFLRALKIKPSLTGANFFLGVDYCKEGEGTK